MRTGGRRIWSAECSVSLRAVSRVTPYHAFMIVVTVVGVVGVVMVVVGGDRRRRRMVAVAVPCVVGATGVSTPIDLTHSRCTRGMFCGDVQVR